MSSQIDMSLIHLAEMALRQARVVRESEYALELMKAELRERVSQVGGGIYPLQVGLPNVGTLTIQAPSGPGEKARISFTF